MSRRVFTCRHLKNGYAAMGKSLARPRYAGMRSRSVHEAIAQERAAAARAAKIKSGVKKR